MPTIDVSQKDLCKLVGKKFSKNELEDALLFVKGEIDGIEGDYLKIDIKETNRPDLWSTEGIARELRARLGIEKGLRKFKGKKSGWKMIIDRSVWQIRPYIAGALIKNVKITEEFLKQLIALQEKITLTYGRKRKKVAIGLYNSDRLVPPIHYKAYKAREIKYVPLDFEREMYLDEILKEHPKGKEYAWIFEGLDKYPVIHDSKGNVCSMTPIINSTFTGKIDANTKNIMLEMTAMEKKALNTAMAVFIAAFAERGYEFEAIEVVEPNGKKYSMPDFTPQKASLDLDYVRKISGLELNNKQIVELLKKARYEVKKIKGNKAELLYPAYRDDILHPIDVVEDVLIGYGYNNMRPERLKLATVGMEMKETLWQDVAREACIGIGLQEILTFTMTSIEKQQDKFGLKEEEFVEIANPMSGNWQIFRKSLMPELLEFLGKNKDAEFPHRIFEVGKTLELNPKAETGVNEKNKVCVALSDKNAGFTQIKSALDALCRNLGIEYKIEKATHPAFVEGRTAKIIANGKSGLVGEINGNALKAFGIEMPVAVFELEI